MLFSRNVPSSLLLERTEHNHSSASFTKSMFTSVSLNSSVHIHKQPVPPQHLYGKAACPNLIRDPSRTPSSMRSPQSSILLTVKLTGDRGLWLPSILSTASTPPVTSLSKTSCGDVVMSDGPWICLCDLVLEISLWLIFGFCCSSLALLKEEVGLLRFDLPFFLCDLELLCLAEASFWLSLFGSVLVSAAGCFILTLPSPPNSPVWATAELHVKLCFSSLLSVDPLW